jgi:hypothetical protein
MKSHIKKFFSIIIYLIGILIILSALSFSFLRYLIQENLVVQSRVSKFIIDATPGDLSFSSIVLTWSIKGPSLEINDPIFSFPAGVIELSYLSDFSITPDYLGFLTGNGLAIKEVRIDKADITFSYSGDLGAEANGSSNLRISNNAIPSMSNLMAILRGIDIIVGDLSLDIRSPEADIFTQQGSLYASTRLDQFTLNFSGDFAFESSSFDVVITGSLDSQADMDIFIEMNNTSASQLFSVFQYALPDFLNEIPMDISFWGSFNSGELQSANAQVHALTDIYFLSRFNQYEGITYKDFGFSAELDLTDNNQSIIFNNFIIDSEFSLWPSDMYVSITAPTKDNFNFLEIDGNYLPIDDSIVIGTQVYQIYSMVEGILGARRLDGSVNDYHLAITDISEVTTASLIADFESLSIDDRLNRTGADNLKGSINASAKNVGIHFDSSDVNIFLGDYQEQYTDFVGMVNWTADGNDSRFEFTDILLLSELERLDGNVALELANSDIITLDMDLNLNKFNLDKLNPLIDLYAPLQPYFSDIRGTIEHADLSVALSKSERIITIDRSDGVAKISSLLFDIELLDESFSGSSVELFMNDKVIDIGGQGGLFSSEDSFEINFKHSDGHPLSFQSHSYADAIQAQKIFVKMAELLPNVRQEAPAYKLITGTINIDTKLDFNLYPVRLNDYSVSSNLDAVQVILNSSDIRLDDLSGVLVLNPRGIQSSNLHADLYGNPIELNVIAIDQFPFDTEWQLTGKLLSNEVTERLIPDWASYIDSTAEALLTLKRPSLLRAITETLPIMSIKLVSNLQEVEISLPEPLFKPRTTKRLLTLNGDYFQNNKVFYYGSVDDDISFNLEYRSLRDMSLAFQKGIISFGRAPLLSPINNGLVVNGTLPNLDIGQWIDLMGSGGSSLKVSEIALNVSNINVYGYSFGSTVLEWRNLNDISEIQLTGDMVAGSLLLDYRELTSTLDARFQYINWPHEDIDIFESSDQSSLAIKLIIDDGNWLNHHFGRVDLDFNINPESISIDSFKLIGNSFQLDGTGNQLEGMSVPQSSISFNLVSQDVRETMEELGVNFYIEGESLDLNASLRWVGELGDWQDPSLDGLVEFNLTNGSVPNIDPGAGRLAGLMSFTALPRRLAFDFRDVFMPGLSYDTIEASYNIKSGVAFTNNFNLTGPIADISITGAVDIANQSYRQLALVYDDAGDVLPSLGFLASPGVGAALLIFSQIFKQPIQGISRAAYCITGTWDEPLVNLLANDLQNSACADL